jgi:hypothetical protein
MSPEFLIDIKFPAAVGPWDCLSLKQEYQEYFLVVEGVKVAGA